MKDLKLLFTYFKGERLRTAAAVLLAIVSVGATLYVPVLIGNATDLIVGADSVAFATLLPVVLQILLAAVVGAASQWLMALVFNSIIYRIIELIRRDAFNRLQKAPLSYSDSTPQGDILSRLTTDIEQVTDDLLSGAEQLLTGLLTIIGTIIFMLAINGYVALVVIFLTPMSLIITRLIAKKSYGYFKAHASVRGEYTSLVDEYIGEQKTVNALNFEEGAKEGMEAVNERLRAANIKATFASSLNGPTNRILSGLVYVSVTLLGAYLVITGSLSVGQLVSYLQYTNKYSKPFNEISSVMTEFQGALASLSRIFALMDAPQEPDDSGSMRLTDVDGSVKIENVYFSYHKAVKLLRDICLDVSPGERVAIVGKTGCGKTTLINLLMRFYDADAGQIYVSGKPVGAVTRDSLRSSFGMVLQDTWLKTQTVRENISFFRPDATLDEVVAASKAAHAHGFITGLTNGYDTLISDNGANLSQGQKQLLSIARVMLADPPMLILDEATSSLDARTERNVQKALANIMKGRTSFVVAHRLSTIMESDVIIVMDAGRIMERGNHEQLLKLNGLYAKMYYSQVRL